ncbi:MAG: VanW family protein [Oscillospiraceae bacterium]
MKFGDKKENEANARQHNHKKLKIVGIAVAVLVAAACISLVCAAKHIDGLDTIYPNVTLNGVQLGGLTLEEAKTKLEESGAYDQGASSVEAIFSDTCKTTISAEDCNLTVDMQEAAELAYRYGRQGGIFSTLRDYLHCMGKEVEYSASGAISIDTEVITATLQPFAEQFEEETEASSVNIREDSIVVIKGASDVSVDMQGLTAAVEEAFINGDTAVDCTPFVTYAGQTDLQALHDTVYQTGYTEKIKGKTKTKTEVWFDMDAAQTALDAAAEGEAVTIELITTTTEEEVTFDESMLFQDLLAEKTTYMSSYNYNRNNNIAKAAAAINGVVLYPGESFSFNGTVGQRTAAAGYLPAGAYANGEVVDELGGGICQVSSTLYYCTLLANLQITERNVHYFSVSYLPWGLDATVSWPNVDFKFVNNREYPIKIVTSVDTNAGTTNIKIYGTDLDGTHVEMTTETWQGSSNFGATSYRNVYDANGTLISSTKEASSTYHYHND